MAIETWSKTAGSNNASPPDGFPEGMAPGSVNDSAREVMAQVRRWAEQEVSATYASDTGSANAYAIAPAVAPSAATPYTTGAIYWFKAANANTGASTLNASGRGAKTIKKFTGSGIADLAAGDILANQLVAVVYDGTNMVMISPVASLGASASTTASGIVELATQAEVDTGTDTVRAVTPATLTAWTPAVGSVTLDPAADKVLIADASGSGVLKQALLAIPTATQADMEAGSSTAVYVTPGRQHFHPGVAKAWVNWNGTTTINSDYGVTSVSNPATGKYTITFDTAFSSSNFVWAGGSKQNTSGANNQTHLSEASRSATTLEIWNSINADVGNTGTIVSTNPLSVVVFGDL